MDNDGTSTIDCADPDCNLDPACAGKVELACADGLDNDSDGEIDCGDPNCIPDPSCIETNCADGVDNDGDTYVDCNDANCASDPSCVVDCAAAPLCSATSCCPLFMPMPDSCGPGCLCTSYVLFCGVRETNCADAKDNDEDGKVDCFDDDCTGSPACEVNCGDTVDNDKDGLTDCSDADCETVPPCCSGVGASCGLGQKDCCAGLTCDSWVLGICTVAAP